MPSDADEIKFEAPPVSKSSATAERKPPHEWAVAKGFLKLNDDGSAHFKTHTPWEFFGARVARKWSDPLVDPSFAITEAEFDAGIAYVLGVTAG